MRLAVAVLLAAVAAASALAASPTTTSTWGNGLRDTLRCAPGPDIVNVDPGDRVGQECETVLVRIAGDGTATPGAQHATIAEPHLAANGTTAVAAYQVGRFRDGGAGRIGIAVSRDAGATWRTALAPPAPGFSRVSDPVVAWDAVHATWLLTLVAETPGARSALLVSRSVDGTAWSAPEPIASDPDFRFDKEWIACDAGAASPHRGRCYVVVNDVIANTIVAYASDDGGVTWSAPAEVTADATSQVGAVPIVLPDGTLVVVWLRERTEQLAARSTDGGATFDAPTRVAPVRTRRVPGVRAVEIPSVAVGPDGTISVAWQGCLGAPCTRNDVVVTTSRDGRSWAAPIRAVRVAGAAAIVPQVAIGPDGAAAILLYAIGPAGIDAWLARRPANGAWGTPQRLTARAIEPRWTADSSLGAMLGDYLGLTWVSGRPLAVLPLAAAPRGTALRQPLFALTRVA